MYATLRFHIRFVLPACIAVVAACGDGGTVPLLPCDADCFDQAGAAGRGGGGNAGHTGGGAAGHAAGFASQGGAGATGGAPQGGADGVPVWVSDPSLWTKVDTPGRDVVTGCEVYTGTSGLGFRPMDWTSCGPGCGLFLPTSFTKNGWAVVGTAMVAGKAESFVHLQESTHSTEVYPTYVLRSWRNLATGEVHGAVRMYRTSSDQSGCAAPSAFADEPRMGAFAAAASDALFSVHWEAGFSIKVSPSLPTGLLQSAWGGWGSSSLNTLFVTSGKVSGWPTDGPTYDVETPSGAQWGDEEGGFSVFVDRPRIRGFLGAGGAVETVAENLPGFVHAPAISPTRIAVLVGDDVPAAGLGAYTGLRVWSAPRAFQNLSTQGEVVELPVPKTIDGYVGVGDFHTWGDWAAVQVGWYGASGPPISAIIVARLSTKKTWMVRELTDTLNRRHFTIDDDYLYFSEAHGKPGVGVAPLEIVRVGLAELDAFVAYQTGQPGP